VASDEGATPSHRPEVWSAFVETGRMTPRFIAVTRDGVLEGGAIALVERVGPFAWIRALPMLLSAAPLALEGRHHEVDRAVGRGMADLQRAERAVGGEWALYRPGHAPDVSALDAVTGETRTMETSLIDLAGGLDAAAARVDRKLRSELRRARSRLTLSEEPDALAEAYALYARQARGWKAHRPLPIELLRRLLASAPAGPAARLYTARDGRGLLAATIALDHPRETMPWWSGSHPDARGTPAFAALLWHVVEWAHAAGRSRVNLGASGGLDPIGAFKDSLGARQHAYPVRWLDGRHAPPAGRWIAAVQSRVRRARARGSRA
jgi:hypothetical protein